MVHTSTPAARRRQARHQVRRAAFLDAAQRILETEGRQALTIARLAREADVAVGGLYRYFDGKEALEAALQVRAIEAFSLVLGAHLNGISSPRDAVFGVYEAWQIFAVASPALHALADQSLSSPQRTLSDAEARRVDLALQAVLVRCDQVLQEAMQAGVLGPGEIRLRTLALWAAVHGVTHFRKRDRILPESQHSERVARVLIEGLIVGWG
jgi:AcrR family transcriptional regulator